MTRSIEIYDTTLRDGTQGEGVNLSLADKLAMFNAVVEMFQAGDYTWVGLDCFARNDDVLSLAQARGELHRNWIGYTTSDSRQMLGFGTHAVSELSNLSVQNHLLIPEWREALDHGSFPLRGGVSFTSAERERRHAMNDLLCNMELKDYAALACVGEEDGPLALLQANGLVDIQQQRVVVTPQGRHVLHGMWGDASPGFRWQNLW